MNTLSKENANSKNENGLTLIEVLVVLIIFSILVAIAVPIVNGVIEKSKKDVCIANLLQLERIYKGDLILNSLHHSNLLFQQYLQDYGECICLIECEIAYVDGDVICSNLNQNNEDSDDDNGGDGVPFFY